MSKRKKILIALFLVFLIFPVYANAAKGVISDEAQICLGCHSNKNLAKQLDSKETLSLFINGDEFANSVHNPFSCAGCHMDISMANHPRVKEIKSKKEYSANASKSCTMCHTDAQLKKKPIHASVITMAKAPTCVECHGSHSIKRISDWKARISEPQYCLTCHRHDISMRLGSGELLSLSVDESVIRKSVHDKLQCSACHIGFSKTDHPKRVFDSKRHYSIVASDVCKKCHEDANKLYEESIHFTLLKRGNLKSPTCIDCHGSHSITKVTPDLGLMSCKKCHGEIYNVYKTSIHGEAITKAKENAPTCTSCHKAHDIKVTARTTKMKDACLKCHKDAEGLHKKWLHNAGLHLNSVSCSTCHAVPDAGRGIYLSLYDKKTGKPFPKEEVLKLMGTDSPGLIKKIDTNGDGSIDGKELWDMFRQLNGKGANVTFMGRMDVQKGTEAHQITGKNKAVRNCKQCHNADSEYFKNVSIVLFKADGMPTVFNAKQEVIGSVYSILPVSNFYVIGGSRVRLLDYLFIIALIGGVAVPIGHITLRIITSPLRHLRKMGKGGKK